MRHLGNGDPLPVVRRLAHHLCGPHKVLDLIFGEGDSGKDLLADLLTATLGPAGAVKVMLGGSGLTVKDLMSCIRSSPYYFEAFRADWKRVFYSILSGAKAAVGTLYPANYEYTTLVVQHF